MRKNFGSKSWFYPLPVLILGTYNPDGTPDAMNAAWGGLYDADKVVLCLSAGHRTTKNIQARGAFTVSFADAAHVVPADYVGVVSGNAEPDKVKKAGFHPVKSEFVDAPLFEELPVAMECSLLKVNEDGNIIGQIQNVSVDASWTPGATSAWTPSGPSRSSRRAAGTTCWAARWAAPSGTACG